MLFSPFAASAQKVTIKADVLRVLQEFWMKSVKITDVSKDSLFIAANHNKLVTQLAIKQYSDSTLAGRRVSGVLPMTGYVPKWDGSRWVPQPDLQGSGGSGGSSFEWRTVTYSTGDFTFTVAGSIPVNLADLVVLKNGLEYKVGSPGCGDCGVVYTVSTNTFGLQRAILNGEKIQVKVKL